ncbi:hypothetical protein K9M79_01505 [Candidatus Woesearchaeota archaeon]|nr:hypothetical protein [Candidatus Woesearchaeota archaeon]
MTNEKKYLEKLENDVQERLYDLFIMHIQNVHEKVSKRGENVNSLIQLLEKALNQLEKNIKDQNKIFIYRYILIICNKILIYQTKRQDIKDLKKKLIEDFTHSEEDQGDMIPLNYQMNEIRLTYDVSYLTYLMKKFVKDKLWDKALYSLIAVRLIEPDNEDIDPCYAEIRSNMGKNSPEKRDFDEPKEMTLALDSNAVITHIFQDVGEYRIRAERGFDLEKLGNDNKFLITSSVKAEVLRHIEYKMVWIRHFCKENPRFSADEIENTLKKRLEKLCSKYGCDDIKIEKELIDNIKKMYLSHLNLLEDILLAKIHGKYVSHKLRKLAQRESMLPEEGDILLLAECATIGGDIGILSLDKDFTNFTEPIMDNFKIKIYDNV